MKELLTTLQWFTRLSLAILLLECKVFGTIDVNLNELEYLAARLNPFECRRLIAALHYDTYELPNSLSGAERNVDDSIPCLRHLLHWNGSPREGRGKTHEVLTHRLQQINRKDLADWLGKSAFAQLGKDLDRAMEKSFDELAKEETNSLQPVTLEPVRKNAKDDFWQQVDVVLVAILLGLLGTLLTLICAMICQQISQCIREIKYRKLKQQDIEDTKQKIVKESKIQTKYATKDSSESPNYAHADSDTDTEFD